MIHLFIIRKFIKQNIPYDHKGTFLKFKLVLCYRLNKLDHLKFYKHSNFKRIYLIIIFKIKIMLIFRFKKILMTFKEISNEKELNFS